MKQKITKPNTTHWNKLNWMCCHCFQTYTKEISEVQYGNETVKHAFVTRPFKCKRCGNTKFMVPFFASSSILSTLQELNLKGYFINPDGWIDGGIVDGKIDDVEVTHIHFSHSLKPEDFKTLPEDWYIDNMFLELDDQVVLTAKYFGMTDDEFYYSDMNRNLTLEEFNKEHDRLISNFITWVSSLPKRESHAGVMLIDSIKTGCNGDCETDKLYLIGNRVYMLTDGIDVWRTMIDDGSRAPLALVENGSKECLTVWHAINDFNEKCKTDNE